MTTEVIFYTQVASIIGFIVALFILYRVLVSAKDAMIELLKEKNSALEEKLAEAKQFSPDILAERLSKRTKHLTEELERFSKDHDKNKLAIALRERQLHETQDEFDQLKQQMERAEDLMSEFFCPHCKAPMVVRQFDAELVDHSDSDMYIDVQLIAFACGFTLSDGVETDPCPSIK